MKSPTRTIGTNDGIPVIEKHTSWEITLSFPNMPSDANSLTMRKFILTALEVFDLHVGYEVKKIKQVRE